MVIVVVGSPSPESVGDTSAAEVLVGMLGSEERDSVGVAGAGEVGSTSALGKSVLKPPMSPVNVGDSVTKTIVTAVAEVGEESASAELDVKDAALVLGSPSVENMLTPESESLVVAVAVTAVEVKPESSVAVVTAAVVDVRSESGSSVVLVAVRAADTESELSPALVAATAVSEGSMVVKIVVKNVVDSSMVTVPIVGVFDRAEVKVLVAAVAESVTVGSENIEIRAEVWPVPKSVVDVSSSGDAKEVVVASEALADAAKDVSVGLAVMGDTTELEGNVEVSEPLSGTETVGVTVEPSGTSVEELSRLSVVVGATSWEAVVVEVSATAVRLSKLSSDVLPEPAPTAGTEPTTPPLCASVELAVLAGSTVTAFAVAVGESCETSEDGSVPCRGITPDLTEFGSTATYRASDRSLRRHELVDLSYLSETRILFPVRFSYL